MVNVPVKPVLAAPLFPRLYETHFDLLRSLTPEQWGLPTACAGWSVKDVASHMLADDVGWLSGGRDSFREKPDRPIKEWDDLVDWINLRNEGWVWSTRRMSTRLLVALAPIIGRWLLSYVDSLDPFAPGPVISWAGSDPAPMWMQIGRELTERWMHHQHICDAVGVESLKDAEMVHAVLDMFVRALPYTYRRVEALDGSVITLWLIGDGGGSWSLMRWDDGWRLLAVTELAPTCTVTLPVDTAWRLFTKGMTGEQARRAAIIEGDKTLAEPLLHMVSIIA
ncbi:MAG: maleylpyruvate isomerase family mycothiol-dependent enzyme [Anaerolineae bacterium]|nr:maleylpyruvate isomerase family mycothiol-dependent enzyme [Anaerolineae bacterium]